MGAPVKILAREFFVKVWPSRPAGPFGSPLQPPGLASQAWPAPTGCLLHRPCVFSFQVARDPRDMQKRALWGAVQCACVLLVGWTIAACPPGSYLAACVIFSSLSGKSSKGVQRRYSSTDKNGKKIFYSMVEKETAQKCQEVADQILFN